MVLHKLIKTMTGESTLVLASTAVERREVRRAACMVSLHHTLIVYDNSESCHTKYSPTHKMGPICIIKFDPGTNYIFVLSNSALGPIALSNLVLGPILFYANNSDPRSVD